MCNSYLDVNKINTTNVIVVTFTVQITDSTLIKKKE